ncbi:Ig-like domain-containing protein [Catenovulum sediminis]|uniref:Ig-like domain-containing protein n=1 Tax=Catenovulum sediminis TaxID=1740262 RepID=A0ABV1RCX1_9ALTE
MKHNLLVKSAAAIAVVSALSACTSDVKEGYDPEFSGSNPVEFDASQVLTATLTEESGEQSIDLLQGATIAGEDAANYQGNLAIRQIEFTADQNFTTPQTESNSTNNLTISPFRISDDGRALLVDTQKFAESLRFCDNTNIRGGGQDDDGKPIADEFLDYPSSVTYTMSYEVNNGYTYAPGTVIPRRTLEITINANQDPVESVNIAPVSVPVGGSSQASAATAPAYACNSQISYSIDDTSIATVDENTGVVSGIKEGRANITATSIDGGFTATAEVTVTAGFTIALTNGEKDALGAYTGKKSVPSCTKSGVVVEPNLEIPGKELTGEYTFDFESSNTADFTFQNVQNFGFGQTAVFTPGASGTSTTVTASYSTGETHGVPASAIADQTLELTVVDNIACETVNPADNATYDFSYGLEHDTMINDKDVKVSADNNSTRWVAIGAASAVSTGLNQGFDGSHALKVSVVDAAFEDPIMKNGIGTLLQRWNSATASWTASNFGRPDAVGKTFKFSVWIKLDSLVAEGEERTITNFLFPWKTADDATYHSVDEYNGFARRNAPFNMQLTQKLENTTDWQLVEFGDFTIPTEWTGLPQPIMMGYEFKGALANGEEILIEDISVVEMK